MQLIVKFSVTFTAVDTLSVAAVGLPPTGVTLQSGGAEMTGVIDTSTGPRGPLLWRVLSTARLKLVLMLALAGAVGVCAVIFTSVSVVVVSVFVIVQILFSPAARVTSPAPLQSPEMTVV